MRWLSVIVLLFCPAMAQADRDIRAFFFGNSLIHHLTDSDETTVPHWLALLAQAGGHGFAADGVWGFPDAFARGLPPVPNWSFDAVDRPMDGASFRMAGFDTIILNPANFIQGDPPDADVQGGSAIDLTARVFDWATNQAPGAQVFIYEGWGLLGDIDGFPPSAGVMADWHAYNIGEGHDWYRAYASGVQAQLTDTPVTLIPVGSVLSQLLTTAPWDTIPTTDLYSDGAPHGTATTYLLAAMVTYVALYDEVPAVPILSETIHPLIRTNYADTALQVFALTTGAVVPQGANLTPPDSGLANPSGAMGLTGLADWSTQLPFLDLMKTSRAWTGHLPGQWGGYPAETLLADGYIAAQGWPVAIPPGVESLETFVLTDLPPQAESAAGRYVLRWQGSGDLTVLGLATEVETAPQEIRFSFTPGPGTVALHLTRTDARDPIRNITLVREDRLELFTGGAVFNPDFLAQIRDLRMIRFMDWMNTNGSPQVVWDDRPTQWSQTWQDGGVPVEVMVQLANEVAADPWFTIPHVADDAYVRAFATYVRDTLDPRLRVYAEWSNEVWNWQFPQAEWAAQQALARWGTREGDAWMQYAGTRAAEVADIWAEVFADDPTRLVRVVATQTGWQGLELPLLDAPLRVAEGLPPPVDSFDAYAVTGYFGVELGGEEMLPQVRDWLALGEDFALTMAAAYLAETALPHFTDELLPYQANVARDRGLDLIMYEGGTHVVALGAAVDDAALTALFTRLNYAPEMALLYDRLITAWHDAGGQAFNAFVDLGAPSKWGSWGHARWLGDLNPRAVTVAALGSLPPTWDDTRAAGTFLHGVIRTGTNDPETLEGTAEEDDLIARDGDDTIFAGSGDRVHGGAGDDLVILPGRAADWLVLPLIRDSVLVANLNLRAADFGILRLTAVETLTFTDEPDVSVDVAAPE